MGVMQDGNFPTEDDDGDHANRLELHGPRHHHRPPSDPGSTATGSQSVGRRLSPGSAVAHDAADADLQRSEDVKMLAQSPRPRGANAAHRDDDEGGGIGRPAQKRAKVVSDQGTPTLRKRAREEEEVHLLPPPVSRRRLNRKTPPEGTGYPSLPSSSTTGPTARAAVRDAASVRRGPAVPMARSSTGHSLVITGQLIWCARCGCYAAQRLRSTLRRECPGAPRRGHEQRLARLREHRHPVSGIYLV
jgi:hypothetical protein